MKGKIKYLVLSITDKCNLECRYCYMGKSGSSLIDLSIIQKAVRMLPCDERCHVQITGGEPGLYPDVIGYAADAVRSFAKGATIGVQTNGTLISEEFINAVKKYNIQVGISIDGRKEVNDALRGNTFSVLSGMLKLQTKSIDFRTTTVVTKMNVDSLPDIPLILANYNNARGMALDLLVRKGRARDLGMEMPGLNEMRYSIIQLIENLKHINRGRKHPILLREIEKFESFKNGQPYCHAALGESMGVSATGHVFPCGQVIGDADFCQGAIDDIFNQRAGSQGRVGKHYVLKEQEEDRWDCPSRIYYNKENEWTDISKIFYEISSMQ